MGVQHTDTTELVHILRQRHENIKEQKNGIKCSELSVIYLLIWSRN